LEKYTLYLCSKKDNLFLILMNPRFLLHLAIHLLAEATHLSVVGMIVVEEPMVAGVKAEATEFALTVA
jgi:hypothetical protein